jgi:hypothetical protein
MCFLAGFLWVSPYLWPNSEYWCCFFLTLWILPLCINILNSKGQDNLVKGFQRIGGGGGGVQPFIVGYSWLGCKVLASPPPALTRGSLGTRGGLQTIMNYRIKHVQTLIILYKYKVIHKVILNLGLILGLTLLTQSLVWVISIKSTKLKDHSSPRMNSQKWSLSFFLSRLWFS